MNPGRSVLRVVSTPPPEEVLDTTSLDPERVYRRYAPYVAAVAFRLLGRHEGVDDSVQEVFLHALKGLKTVRDPNAIKGWLAKITVRVVRRRLRLRRLRTFLGLEHPVVRDLASELATPEQRTLLAQVYEQLDEMAPDLRIAWVLRHVEGARLDDVALACGCSLATAKRRIASAARQLEEALDVS